jgi:hypothetical protein
MSISEEHVDLFDDDVEVTEVTQRGLDLLAFRVMETLEEDGDDHADLLDATRKSLERYPFDLQVGRYDMSKPDVVAALPAAVVDAWVFFDDRVSKPGWGVVQVWDAAVGADNVDVHVVHAFTAAGDGYVEVYDTEGSPLLSGTTDWDQLDEWDEKFGDSREAASYLAE